MFKIEKVTVAYDADGWHVLLVSKWWQVRTLVVLDLVSDPALAFAWHIEALPP